MSELSLEDWLSQTEESRGRLRAYANSPLPCDQGERHADFDRAIQNEGEAATLLAEANSFLIQAEAKAIFNILQEFRVHKLSQHERRVLALSRIRDVQTIADDLKVLTRKISNRIFVGMNENRGFR